MKKAISVIMILTIFITCLSGCAKKPVTDNENTDVQEDIDTNDNVETGTDSKNPASDNTDSGSNNAAVTNDTQNDTDQKPSSSGQQNLPDSSNDSGTSSGGSQNSWNPEVIIGGEPGDIDPDEIPVFESDGEIDYRYEGVEDDLPYIDKAETTISDFIVTSDNYDERKLSLPIIKINTYNGKDITSKTQYVSSTISITNTLKNYSLTETTVDVRGRGNSTWQYFDKKAYKLKFTVKTDLFGMGAAKKWVLLANALDESMMRNYIAFSLGHILNLEYTSDFQFVNLYLNGEYKGVYLLCEQVQEGETRVNINSSKTGQVDTGYLLEGINVNMAVDYKTFTLDSVNGQQLGDPGKFTFIIKSPELLECTSEQVSYISDYVKKANEAIFNKDWASIQNYIDVDSFVNMFLLDEILLNQDMGYSFYMYKKQSGKLYMGPMWDFDQACGSSSHGGIGYKGWYAGSEHEWFTTLIEIPQFKELVSKRYQQKKDEIHSLLDSIDNIINKHSFDFAMSNYVFNTFGDTNRWRTVYEIASLKTYKEHVVFLKTWLTNRFIWMEDQLGVK